MSSASWVQGFLLGLTLSPTCFGVCFPLLVPYFSSEEHAIKIHFWNLGRFLFGRLLGYAVIGLVAGWIGQAWFSSAVHTRWLEGFGFFGVGLLLLAYGLVKSFPHWTLCQWAESRAGTQRTPLWLGIVTGLNICPPFVAALFEAVRAGGIGGALAVFVGFFCGTSIILLPLGGLGVLAKVEALRMGARIAAMLIGAWFMLQGAVLLWARG